MSTQQNNFRRPTRVGVTRGFVLSRRILAGVATVLMGASLVFTSTVFAHNTDLAKAWELTRDYARSVRAESGGKYLHYSTNCVRAFPGHNHIVRCVIEYQNAKDTAARVYTCKETIELKMKAHSQTGGYPVYTIYGQHTSNNKCGSRWLTETPLS